MKKLIANAISLAMVCAITISAAAQEPAKPTRQRRAVPEAVKANDATRTDVTNEKAKPAIDEVFVGDEEKPEQATSAKAPNAATVPSDVPAHLMANRHDTTSDEASIVPFYNNFFTTYRLGPEDVISVTVFGQDRYSRQGISIPPSGRISLALIPDGIFVDGKTVEEVSELIKKRYDEFIIEPQVSVSLDKANSYRYSVIGDVAAPGIRPMQRRMSVTEAIAEAGGVLQTGDRSKVYVLRKQASGNLAPIPVNVAAIYKGKAPDSTYLQPGDQVVVPGNTFKKIQSLLNFLPVLSFAKVFTGGIF
jgi:polysaccharide export outer membrane protein